MAAQRPTIAIVGAGPAGSAAAHVTASHGLRTILIDRAKHPREKVCGEGCTPRAVQNLRRMGVLDELEDQAAPVSHGFLVSPGGVEMLTPLPQDVYGGRALVIPRSTLDERLVQRAARAGADLRQDVRVERVHVGPRSARLELHGYPSLDVDAVLGCDGIPSIVRRSLGAPALGHTQTAHAIRGIYDDVHLDHPNAMTLIWDRSVLPAYGWIFPLPSGAANIGIGVRMDQLKRGCQSLQSIFERFLELPRVRRAIEHARPRGKPKGHLLPMTTEPGGFVFDRALLAGDAAGFVNPLTGEGIEYALESGELAGRVLVLAAHLGSFTHRDLMPYAWACADQFRGVLRLNGWLRCIFSVPWLLDRIFRAGNRSAALRDDVARIALGGPGARITPRIVWGALAG